MQTISRKQHWWHKTVSLVGALALMTGEMSASFGSAAAQSQPQAERQAYAIASNQQIDCQGADSLQTGGMRLRSTFNRSLQSNVDWVKFRVQQDQRYQLQISNAADLHIILYDRCTGDVAALVLPDGQLEFTATRSSDYYLQVTRANNLSSASLAGYQVSLAPAALHRPSIISVTAIPEAVQRRAVAFLEELRGSDLAPEWKEGRINPEARILYRPDMQTPAYYEFNVEKPAPTGGFEAAGFIQLGAGEHDYPVTHWDVTGMSPTQELQELAPTGAMTVTQFYKVDGLAYAAEYETPTAIALTTVATDVLNIGDLPGRIEGIEALGQTPAALVSESVDSNGTVTHEGPDELPLSDQKDWESWAALKAGYKEEYAPLLASLAQRASEPWKLENGLNQHGESLIKGDIRTIQGLPAQTISTIAVTGDGAAAQFLQQEQVTVNGAVTAMKLTVLAEPSELQTRLPVNILVQYTSGVSETVKYAIVNNGALVSNQVFLPLINNGAGNNLAGVASVDQPTAPSDWGPWSYWWAAGDAGANRYGQVDVSGCASGCGGTAWAMLFGWVDQHAAANVAPWTNHWGIYRQDGGTGANMVAPTSQDAGIRNMTLEIRGQIGTFCIFGSGATWPWRMIDAANYVRPRATAGWRMNTKYDPTGLCWFGACNGARDLAIDAIINRRQPAIVGTGWLKHYPLAYGYAQRSKRSCFLWVCSTDYSRWFYVNNGWYGSNNGWTSADVWFGGTYYNN